MSHFVNGPLRKLVIKYMCNVHVPVVLVLVVRSPVEVTWCRFIVHHTKKPQGRATFTQGRDKYSCKIEKWYFIPSQSESFTVWTVAHWSQIKDCDGWHRTKINTMCLYLGWWCCCCWPTKYADLVDLVVWGVQSADYGPRLTFLCWAYPGEIWNLWSDGTQKLPNQFLFHIIADIYILVSDNYCTFLQIQKL